MANQFMLSRGLSAKGKGCHIPAVRDPSVSFSTSPSPTVGIKALLKCLVWIDNAEVKVSGTSELSKSELRNGMQRSCGESVRRKLRSGCSAVSDKCKKSAVVFSEVIVK
jgi:hypothetical protein